MAFEIPRRALASYSLTGHAPETPHWAAIEARHDLNPARFDRNHPTLTGLFTQPHCLGELPASPFYDFLRRRYEINPVRFTHYHPFLGKLLARDREARLHCDTIVGVISPPGALTDMAPTMPILLPSIPVPIPTVTQPVPGPVAPAGAITEPSSLTLLTVGLVLSGLYTFIRR
jgi:hypothetical protein